MPVISLLTLAIGLLLGANAFLTKPSEASKLQDMVRAIKDFWLTHNTLPQESSPESPMKGVVNLVHSSTTDFAERRRSPVKGKRREEWPPNTEAGP